jgi:hypothetical protein
VETQRHVHTRQLQFHVINEYNTRYTERIIRIADSLIRTQVNPDIAIIEMDVTVLLAETNSFRLTSANVFDNFEDELKPIFEKLSDVIRSWMTAENLRDIHYLDIVGQYTRN